MKHFEKLGFTCLMGAIFHGSMRSGMLGRANLEDNPPIKSCIGIYWDVHEFEDGTEKIYIRPRDRDSIKVITVTDTNETVPKPIHKWS